MKSIVLNTNNIKQFMEVIQVQGRIFYGLDR